MRALPAFTRPALAVCLGGALLLGGCASEKPPPLLGSVQKGRIGRAPIVTISPLPASTAQPGPHAKAQADAALPAGNVSAAGTEELPSVIYFDPDAYQVKADYRPMLEAHAKRLIADPDLMLRIDGHTDESGPPDYNRELARMRAHMVMKQLIALGVPKTQLQVVGHGEGRRNGKRNGNGLQANSRRVELTYR